MIHIPPAVTKVLAVTLLPKIIDAVTEAFTKFFEEEEQKPKRSNDSTRFSQMDFDIVMQEWQVWKDENEIAPVGQKTTQEVLTKRLNDRLGYHKHRTTYAQIWLGHLQRSSLRSGQLN